MRCRRTNFWTLPLAVRGKSSTACTSSGHFCRARPDRRSGPAARPARDGRSGLQPDDGRGVLAEPRVRCGHHHGFGDAGHAQQHLLDLRRADVLAAADDEVGLAVGDGEVTVLVEHAYVARVVSAVVVEGPDARAEIRLVLHPPEALAVMKTRGSIAPRCSQPPRARRSARSAPRPPRERRRPEDGGGLHPVRQLERDHVTRADARARSPPASLRAIRSTSLKVPAHGRTAECTRNTVPADAASRAPAWPRTFPAPTSLPSRTAGPGRPESCAREPPVLPSRTAGRTPGDTSRALE